MLKAFLTVRLIYYHIVQILMSIRRSDAFAANANHHANLHKEIQVMNRPAYVYKPLVQTATRPAIFVLHGSGCIAADMFTKGFEELADIHDFLVVYPEMQMPRSDLWGYHEDIPYLAALIDHLQESDFGLIPQQVYVVGHSAGGSFALFLQNEVSLFQAAGAVEGAVGHLNLWAMTNPGHRSMVIWNHADPVLEQYAPAGGEPAYYSLTISTLRRHGGQEHTARPLPTSDTVTSATLLHYPDDGAPELAVLSFTSKPGRHDWPSLRWASFDASEQLVKFFLQLCTSPCVVA